MRKDRPTFNDEDFFADDDDDVLDVDSPLVDDSETKFPLHQAWRHLRPSLEYVKPRIHPAVLLSQLFYMLGDNKEEAAAARRRLVKGLTTALEGVMKDQKACEEPCKLWAHRPSIAIPAFLVALGEDVAVPVAPASRGPKKKLDLRNFKPRRAVRYEGKNGELISTSIRHFREDIVDAQEMLKRGKPKEAIMRALKMSLTTVNNIAAERLLPEHKPPRPDNG